MTTSPLPFFEHLKQFMSPKEIRAYLASPENGSRFIGHAVHRATAAGLERIYPARFDYNATRSIDFIDKDTGEMVELTTEAGVNSHLQRGGTIVTYK